MSKGKQIETSKVVTFWVLKFTGLQIFTTMLLDCLFPVVAGTLNTICLSVIAGCISIVSWYFGKALGENKLKIKNGNSTTEASSTEGTSKGLLNALDTIKTVATELSGSSASAESDG